VVGRKEWYATPDPTIDYEGGYTLGNSFRIHGDGDSWAHLSGCTNTIAAIGKYSRPGGWADPDLLIGPETKKPMHIGGQTDEQARTQFNLWSVFPAPLLISQNVLTWSKFALQTYSNTDVIAVNQDFVTHGPGARLAGGDLAFPCVEGSINCTNVWGRVLSDESLAIVFVNNGKVSTSVTCDAACFGKLVAISGVLVNERRYIVHNLWTNTTQEFDASKSGYTSVVQPNGGSEMYRFHFDKTYELLV